MGDLDELDALHAAATAGEWVDYCFADTVATTRGAVKVDSPGRQLHVCETRSGPDGDPDCRAIVALHNAWPSVSARLRAAEALVAVVDDVSAKALVRLKAQQAEVERLRGALLLIATGRFASVAEACDIAEDALGADVVAAWNAAENARAAMGEP